MITVGITLDALDTLGEAESISLPAEGDDFNKDDIVCEIEGGGRSIKITLPATGFVSEINEQLVEDITILNEDLIDEGWLVKLEIEDESELAEYL